MSVDSDSLSNLMTDGYPTYPLSGLMDAITAVIEDGNKTPLLIDNSEEENVTTFLSYKVTTLMPEYDTYWCITAA